MQLDEYINLLESPDSVCEEDINDIIALLGYAPYMASAQILLLKALHKTHKSTFKQQLNKASLYARKRQDLYFLLYTKKVVRHVHAEDYFSLMQLLEQQSEKTGQSLSELAQKYKQARLQYIKSK